MEGRCGWGILGWDESLANMHTLDRWRDTVSLHYDEDKQALEPAAGL